VPEHFASPDLQSSGRYLIPETVCRAGRRLVAGGDIDANRASETTRPDALYSPGNVTAPLVMLTREIIGVAGAALAVRRWKGSSGRP